MFPLSAIGLAETKKYFNYTSSIKTFPLSINKANALLLGTENL